MNWMFRQINHELAHNLAHELGQPLKLGEFLSARGFRSASEVRSFVRADLKDLPQPFSFTDMDKAVDRLLWARKNDELVAICGDYDADGLTASALLAHGLKALGHRVFVRVPHRLTEGYGLRPPLIEEVAAKGATLVVTVDNGVSSHEAVDLASALGLDVIITDHHRLPPELPKALALINPHRDECWRVHPPAGVGVAFMLLAALRSYYREKGEIGLKDGPPLLDFLPFVAIGAIADMVPLGGANRIMVRHGLDVLASSRLPGLMALKHLASPKFAEQCRISPRDVGFRLAPRLNAAGRLGSADPALNLLLADDEANARTWALRLEELNRERYNLQNKLCREALERLEEEVSPDASVVVLSGEGWPRGILGLAASKVADAARKPTILFGVENGLAVGSGRSFGSFNLHSALSALSHLYVTFGGHAQAAGVTMEADKLHEFTRLFQQTAEEMEVVGDEPDIIIDIAASISDLSLLAGPLEALEPFGQGHPSPCVMLPAAKITEARPTENGGEDHMKMLVSDGLNRLRLIGFNLAPRLCEISREMDLVLSPEYSEYKGQVSRQWRLIDFRTPQAVR